VTPDAKPSHAAPGTPGTPISLTAPRMMRALAHPARMAIRQHRVSEDKERLSADKGLSRAGA
jgi:hypothetical protein